MDLKPPFESYDGYDLIGLVTDERAPDGYSGWFV